MTELEHRVADLQVRLIVLSEAGTLNLQLETHGKPDSTPPPGANPDRRGVPDPDDYLLGYFEYHLARARTEARKKALVAECEIRLRKRLNGREARAVAGSMGTSAPSGILMNKNVRSEHERRVAENYEGFTPEEVSAIEGEAYGYCPVAHVRQVRLNAHRSADTGEPETPADISEKRQYVYKLLDNGVSIRSCAQRASIAKSTAQNWKKDWENVRSQKAA